MPSMSVREIAEICDTRFQRRPSHHSIKTVLASGPPPSIQMRRFPLFNDTPDPAQRRHNIVQLHAEGWSVASIAKYLAVIGINLSERPMLPGSFPLLPQGF